MFSISVWRGANCDCSSAWACFPSAVLPMAPRILITPTLPGAGLGAGDCARTTATIRRPAAARATVCNFILEFTLFSLFFETIRKARSEEHTSELQSRLHLVCRLLL